MSEIARTILVQLGGMKFIAMGSVKDFSQNGLQALE